MSSAPKRVREQAVVYLGERDRELLENLAKQTGLSRTEIFRRGLWALAAQTQAGRDTSAFEYLIANARDAVDLPSDFSERSDEYLYGGGYDALATHPPAVAETPAKRAGHKRKPPRARSR